MADIELYQDDHDDEQEEGDESGLGIEDLDIDPYNTEESSMSALQKLQRCVDSENVFSRQMVGRNLVDAMRQVSNDEDLVIVLHALQQLADDPESIVRTELAEQMPHMAMCAQERTQFSELVPAHLLPIVVKYLTDCNNQVRKTSQAALLVLVEQEQISTGDVEQQVCPIIMQLSDAESIDEFRTEAVALMSKMAPLVGHDLTEKYFLMRFSAMCTDALFHVRKVCAANFGDFCAVVGQENTEKHLLPKFYYLCEDGVWGVRKACAECFMQVSCLCSLQTRRNELAELFITLICDQSRWVRMAAFQALGGFISTFADPNLSGIYMNEEGEVIALQREKTAKDLCTISTSAIDTDDMTHSSVVTSSKSDTESSASNEPVPSVCDKPSNEACLSSQTPLTSETDTQSSPSNTCVPQVETVPNMIEECDDTPVCQLSSNTDTCSDDISIQKEKCLDSKCQENQSSKLQCTSNEACAVLSDNNNISLKSSEDLAEFNSFRYWREPLPAIEIGNELAKIQHLGTDCQEPTLDSTAVKNEPIQELECDNVKPIVNVVEVEDKVLIHTASVDTVCTQEETVANIGSTHVIGQHVNEATMAVVNGVVTDAGSQGIGYCPRDESTSSFTSNRSRNSSCTSSLSSSQYDQDVIPQALLDHYLSMTDPSRAQTVDSEISRHCAYSLPAVAYTLGRRNWPCLRELYDTLAGDMHWKVRRTLAFSIHELAQIVGEDVTSADLVPVFNGFLKDLDEVRVGVLKHLTDFLKLLRPEIRGEYLMKIRDFLNTDNNRNWRFREELAEQLLLLTELYTPLEVKAHLMPVAMSLALDKVAEVRQAAFIVLSRILRRVLESKDRRLALAYFSEVVQTFAHHNQWKRRQMYAQLCNQILEEKVVHEERFAQDLMPPLLGLATDSIPNVRISLAKTLGIHLLTSDFFQSKQNPHYISLNAALEQLRNDGDQDVRHFLLHQSSISMSEAESIPV